MSDYSIARVHYFERQFLRTQDFVDEQAYHLAMRRRHNIAHHTWGIVYGLGLEADEGNLFVQPGMAIDGYGRELVLPEKQILSTAAFADKGSEVLDVWLLYDRRGSDRAPLGYAGCGDGDEVPFYRWQERPLVRLDVPDPAFPNRREPESVPTGDLAFNSSRTPPDDPQEDWPVFLGQIRFNPANPDQPYSVDPADRPYAGLRGELILAPSRRASVQIGAELESDPRRFAVFVPAEDEPGMNSSPARLEINQTGEISVRGQTTLRGDLKVDGGAVEFGAGLATSAQPWNLYHNFDETSHELRLEMAAGAEGLNQVVIGFWSSEDEEFKSCLTIADDCSVTVRGNLIVEGQITEGADLVETPLSQEASRLSLTGFVSGVSGANTLLERFYRSPVAPDTGPLLLSRLMARQGGMPAVVEGLASNPEQLAAFVDLIRAEHPELGENLRQALSSEEGNGEAEGGEG